MQKARRHPNGLRPLVSVWFQDLFHSLIQGSFHLSLTVLVHYRSLNIFSLTGWFRQIHTELHMFRTTQDTVKSISMLYRIVTFFDVSFQTTSSTSIFYYTVLQPHQCRNKSGLGCSLFARRYLGNHYYFLFLRLLRCFSSPGLHPFG